MPPKKEDEIETQLEELLVFDTDAPKADDKKKKITITPAPSVTPPATVTTEPKKFRHRCLKYTKISILFGVWLIFGIAFLLKEEEDSLGDLLTLNTVGYINVVDSKVKEKLGLSIMAAFDDSPNHKDNEPYSKDLVVQVQRVYFDNLGNIVVVQNITEDWHLRLMSEDKLEQSVLVTKSKEFLLNTNENRLDYEEDIRILLATNLTVGITVKTWIEYTPLNIKIGIIIGTVVLIFLYIFIIWEIINRTLSSIIAATLSLGILSLLHERPNLDTIMSWIDVETFLLLFGMMILVAILAETGIFDYSAVYAYKISKGNIWALILCLGLFSALMSALLDNVTLMLLITPVTIRLCEVKSLDPVPVIICLVMFSNVGAASTPVGDPPNVIISTNAHIASHDVHFLNFVLHMIPGVLLGIIQTYFQLRVMYRRLGKENVEETKDIDREIKVWENAAEGINAISQAEDMVQSTFLRRATTLKNMEGKGESDLKKEKSFEDVLADLKANYPIRNKILLVKSTIAFVFIVVLFILHSVPHLHYLSLGWAALLGSLLLLILADVKDLEAILTRIEWSTLLFFATLIILMETLTELGVIKAIGNLVVQLILTVTPSYRLAVALIIVLWTAAIASAFLDNIPVATMMVKIIITLNTDKNLKLPMQPLVWALAFGACFGGNGTLIGASANVVSSGIAEQHGYKLNFLTFFRVGFPVMIGNVIIANIYLLFAHVLFQWHADEQTNE